MLSHIVIPNLLFIRNQTAKTLPRLLRGLNIRRLTGLRARRLPLSPFPQPIKHSMQSSPSLKFKQPTMCKLKQVGFDYMRPIRGTSSYHSLLNSAKTETNSQIILLQSVTDPECLSRIQDAEFYPSRIPDPEANNSNKRRGKKLVVLPFL